MRGLIDSSKAIVEHREQDADYKMSNEKKRISEVVASWHAPVLIISSLVGRGNYSIGEAIRECIGNQRVVYHIPIEHMLPLRAVHEDLNRYKFISDNLRFLLYLIYKVPLFYYRKFLREKLLGVTNLDMVEETIRSKGVKTVVCVSHRPAFWLSVLKSRRKVDFRLCGILAEFGTNLGWRYIFWEAVDQYLSPVEKSQLRLPSYPAMEYVDIKPPCRDVFYELAEIKGDANKVLLVFGYWGQISAIKAGKVIRTVTQNNPLVHVYVVCGTNRTLFKRLTDNFRGNPRVIVYGAVESLAGLMRECACVITKPGFSTLVESFAAGRKIFLLRGMPVAEDNNARYACEHFYAEWFTKDAFRSWYIAQRMSDND
ncbi:MAG: hypothetical protein NC923_06600 [Candidatus Omnitrophica bacterium]|nr:hypothetical protein [Candidatus Omnitrophota bacterium]